MGIAEHVTEKAKSAKAASYMLAALSTGEKNRALEAAAGLLDKNRKSIIEANIKDIEACREKGLKDSFIDRLAAGDKQIDTMIKSLRDVIALPDPAGEITGQWERPNGLKIRKMRVPLGVIGMIFESRPNVCVEASSLAIKSGNSLLLRGGSDSINSNISIIKIIKEAFRSAGLPEGAVELVEDTDRKGVEIMLGLKGYIDVIIPRGGKGLVDLIAEKSRIPVIYHDAGICHTYVDKAADIDMAVKVCVNAKAQRPSTCNAMETMLVHKDIAPEFLPKAEKVFVAAKVSLKADKESKVFIPSAQDAAEDDYRTEYNDYILNIKMVGSIEEALAHINTYGSRHSDAIITGDKKAAEKFVKEADSAACFVNASTRFHDGFEFGLGAEMGISNQKLHVRGPLALVGLTSEKYVVTGAGHIRE
ncbi:MAG TPA: glutamate-5-semialdehyde dehydrogenase [bacterium]|nr:glutamate-5-semialdehyde dehydrogenase [bacterium]